MKFSYRRKVNEHQDRWEECLINHLKQGDIFYMMEGDMEGPFLTAKSNPVLMPSKLDESKIIWHIETEPMSDENFS